MKHLIFIFIIALFSVKCHEEELDPEYIKQINEEIMKNLKEMNITNTQTISKAQFVVLFKRLFEKNNPKGEGVPPSAVEDQFMFDVVRAVIKDVPEQISIHDIYKYMDPRKLEKIVNDMLSGMDLTKIMGDYEKERYKAQEELDKKKKEMEEKQKIKPNEEVITEL